MTRRHKKFVKDAMGWIGMSRNRANQVYKEKDFWYQIAVSDIEARKALLSVDKAASYASRAFHELFGGIDNYIPMFYF